MNEKQEQGPCPPRIRYFLLSAIEPTTEVEEMRRSIDTLDLLAASQPAQVDALSYHHYGAVSLRCAPKAQTTSEAALSEQWLRRTDETLAFYRRLINPTLRTGVEAMLAAAGAWLTTPSAK